MATVRPGQGVQGGVGATLPGTSSASSPRTTLPGASTASSFTQLSASQAATIPASAPNTGIPSFRLMAGVDPQRTFANSLTDGTTGANLPGTATTAAATPSGSAATGSAPSGDATAPGGATAPGSTPNPNAPNGQGVNNFSGGTQAGKDEMQMVKDLVAELRADGETGSEDELYQMAIFIKGQLDKNLAKNYDEARKQYKKEMARIERMVNGQDPVYES